jgi:hypothetical protein
VDARLRGDSAALELPVVRGSRITLQCKAQPRHVDDKPLKSESVDAELSVLPKALEILRPLA